MKSIKKLVLIILLFCVLLVGCTKNKEYVITFNTNGGSEVSSIITDGKSSIDLPNDLTKDGYDFEGWYWDSGFLKEFYNDSLVEEPIKEDITIYANWTIKEQEKVYNYVVTELELNSNEYTLDGEMLIPISDHLTPVVIIVPGSGPVDMDGSINNQTPYKDIAYSLAKKGIASVRCNKVTYQHIDKVVNDYDFTIIDEYEYMVDSMIQSARLNKNFDHSQIYLLGHSLGAQIIPKFLAFDDLLAGGIIMGGTTMHILDLILEQTKKQSEEMYLEYLPYVEDVKSLTEVREGEENYIYFGAYQAYYVNYNKMDLELVKQLNCPLLVMQGNLDLQIGINHYNKYKELLKDNSKAQFVEYANLNHLFTNGEGESINNAYQKDAKVDQRVIDDIIDYINSN
ncbi:MAG: InlB B-repeat-containing protein [Bacilli bacterium]